MCFSFDKPSTSTHGSENFEGPGPSEAETSKNQGSLKEAAVRERSKQAMSSSQDYVNEVLYKNVELFKKVVTPSPPFQNGMAQTRCQVSSVYVVFLLCLSWIFTHSDLLMFSVLSLFFLRIINNFSFLLCCHFWHIHQWWSYCNKCRGFNCHTSLRVTFNLLAILYYSFCFIISLFHFRSTIKGHKKHVS